MTGETNRGFAGSTIEQTSRAYLGFSSWHLAVVLVASIVTVLAAIRTRPLTGLVGLLIAALTWASVIKLCQIGNAVLVERLGDRLPGVMTLRLYALSVIAGLVGVTGWLAVQTPTVWAMSAGRFTPVIAVSGLLLGAAIAFVVAIVASVVART